VRGIGHELPLGAHRLLQLVEGRVEGAGEAAELVVAALREPAPDVAIARHRFGPLGEAAHRGERGARDQGPEPGRECDARERERGEDRGERAEHAVDLVERAGHLDGLARLDRLGEHAQVLAVHVAIGEEGTPLAARDGPHAVVNRQSGAALAARQVRLARGGDELHVALGAAEAAGRGRWKRAARGAAAARSGPLVVAAVRIARVPVARGRRAARRRAAAEAPARAPGVAPREVLDRRGAVAERVVDLAAHLRPHRHVRRDRRKRHRHGHRDGRRQRQAPPDGHGSRRMYPTPRTVWSSSLAPTSDSFLRR
jgi:hypothetical protein